MNQQTITLYHLGEARMGFLDFLKAKIWVCFCNAGL